ncbi:MAG: amino acid ABC transporter ATP-binding protein [Lachnospiraceae bacterium]|nr:amino acid ABC transporter ATP-binding protein [Lachnospiraceae bacterium]
MVELEHIKKKLGGKEILKDVSLQVNEGEVVAIIGPSGSGKTTLLRTVNFLNPADSGAISVDGYKVDAGKHKHREALRLRKKTGMVFQGYNLFKNRTVLQNVTEGLIKVQKKPKAEAEEIAIRLLTQVRMDEKLHSYPSQLSGGQQQRVGICRALAASPKVVLLDEPTSALDPELVGEILDIIKEIAKTGITMLIVTHEIAFAREIANRVVFMKDGVIVEQGQAKEVLEHPKNQETKNFLKALLPERSIEYVI